MISLSFFKYLFSKDIPFDITWREGIFFYIKECIPVGYKFIFIFC